MPSPSSSSLLQVRGQMLRRLHIGNTTKQWSIKQVNRSNLTESLQDLKTRIFHSDFIAISLQNTGSFSASWHRNLPFDSSQIAYFKAKNAAENFQTLQFAVCPFSIVASDIVPHPFNFHLFPRDELNFGMPTYSFSCQISYLTSMARDDFDFNACINDGISYLSRAQESLAKLRLGKAPQCAFGISSSTPTLADSIFIERVKSRIKHWKDACKTSSKTNDELLRSLKKLISGNDMCGSRPCMNVDVCSERQVQLVLELSRDVFSDLVSIVVPAKSGGSMVVCVILTSSKEDKELLERELQNVEEEENMRLRGFREVIELISASKKPVVSFNSLNDFTFIHSKFLAPLPPTLDKFSCSLDTVFPLVFDLRYLMSDIGPLSKMTNTAGALSYLKDHFFAPVNFEIPDLGNEGKIHGHEVVNVCHLFAKICSIRKISTHDVHSDSKQLLPAFEEYANNFSSFASPQELTNDNIIRFWAKNTRKISSEHLVFLWGFGDGMTSQTLKALLQGSHNVFNEEFDVRFVDKSCAIIVFWNPGLSEIFMEAMNSGCISASLMEIVSEGLRATDYETYRNACKLGLWEINLADSLEKVLVNSNFHLEADLETRSTENHRCNDSFIYLDDL